MDIGGGQSGIRNRTRNNTSGSRTPTRFAAHTFARAGAGASRDGGTHALAPRASSQNDGNRRADQSRLDRSQ